MLDQSYFLILLSDRICNQLIKFVIVTINHIVKEVNMVANSF